MLDMITADFADCEDDFGDDGDGFCLIVEMDFGDTPKKNPGAFVLHRDFERFHLIVH